MNKIKDKDSLKSLNTVAQKLSENELACEPDELLNLIMEQLKAGEL
ncbi:hypothetical protein [Moritella yayanosii]|uniref:Uncharacterized protein n=1 Tax=Moritella yayanosii TaxID=69539 RepID=A0A330LNG7_9GAMM|nr:hypothetical protein [Moritella yayanosii]SQD78547.1 protein of unknown function [Moritella yayanosii]